MKGRYGMGRLSVARSYTKTDQRLRLLLMGAIGALVTLAFFGGRALLGDRLLLAPGELSSAHADLSCGTCHRPFSDRQTMSGQCIDCHDAGVSEPVSAEDAANGSQVDSDYSLFSHATRSGDGTTAEGEWNCTQCHGEHRRNDGASRRALVEEASCDTCHDTSPFSERHPEFAVLRAVDPMAPSQATDTLLFEHPQHVAVAVERGLASSAEASCLTCHEPDEAGVSFSAISFDRHCVDCHLDGGQSTDWLPIASDPLRVSSEEPGVLTLEQLAGRVPPPSWLRDFGSGGLRERRGSIRRVGVRHADPWVLENLRRLRDATEESEEALAALLATTVDAESETERQRLSRSAVSRLRQQLEALRQLDDPGLAAEVGALEQQLRAAERRIERGETLRITGLEGTRSGSVSASIEDLAVRLLASCTTCHTLDGLRIRSIDPDLRVLRAGHFDHQAHLLTGSCASCHRGLTETSSEGDQVREHHLPGVSSCQECHRAARAVQTCETCHRAHPQAPAARRFLEHVTARAAALAKLESDREDLEQER